MHKITARMLRLGAARALAEALVTAAYAAAASAPLLNEHQRRARASEIGEELARAESARSVELHWALRRAEDRHTAAIVVHSRAVEAARARGVLR